MAASFASRNRALIVWFTTIALFTVLFLYENHLSQGRCEDRKINIKRANDFNERMVFIEEHNPYIDNLIRKWRVEAYKSLIYVEPKC